MNRRLSRPLLPNRRMVALLIVCSLMAAVLGAGVMYLLAPRLPCWALSSQGGQTAQLPENEQPRDPSIITLPKTMWALAGIRVDKVRRCELGKNVWVTGKIALNEDRVAQVTPSVEGMVREVQVQFGDDVTAGEILAVVDSREVGNAKLKLHESRLTTRLAEVNYEWAGNIEENTQALIRALKAGTPLEDIERTFRDKAMGDYRQQLVSAYAQLHKARADRERLKNMSDRGISAGKEFLAAEATRDAAEATFQALLEQVKFTSAERKLAAEHELEKARTSESVSSQSLRILGTPSDAIDNLDLTAAGQEISYYPIKTPFSGTIIEKDVALMERVGPADRLFTIADLSTVWVQVDIYEHHLPLLGALEAKAVRFRSSSYPNQIFEARVSYTGDIVNEQSRTLPMTAIADNPDRLLKPGMFVEVELPGERVAEALVVPASALQEHDNLKFVFVHLDGDRFVRRNVSVGGLFDGGVEITEGLHEQESVVVEGGFFLKSQMLTEQFADED